MLHLLNRAEGANSSDPDWYGDILAVPPTEAKWLAFLTFRIHFAFVDIKKLIEHAAVKNTNFYFISVYKLSVCVE